MSALKTSVVTKVLVESWLPQSKSSFCHDVHWVTFGQSPSVIIT